MLDIALNNAWILYKREYKALLDDKKFMPIKQFRNNIAKAFLAVADSKQVAVGSPRIDRPRTPMFTVPHDETRYDHVGSHMPTMMDLDVTRPRCAYCHKGRTIMMCGRCKVPLCIVRPRNCFKDFHTPST